MQLRRCLRRRLTKTVLTWPNHRMYASNKDRRRLCRRRCSRELLPTVQPPMLPTVKPSIINRQVPYAVKRAAKPPAPESSNARRVSNRTTKGQPPIRFGQNGYVAFLIAILFLFHLNNVSALHIPSWNNISSEEVTILDGAVYWHSWERAILLSG